MSIITRAHLTLLSHKCLTVAARRYEYGSGCLQNPNHTYLTLTQHMQTLANRSRVILQANKLSPSCWTKGCQPVELRSKELNLYDTPKPCQRRNQVLDRILVKELISEANHANLALLIVRNTPEPSTNSLNKYDSLWTEFNDHNNNKTTTFSNSRLRRRINYLFDGERKRHSVQLSNPLTTTFPLTATTSTTIGNDSSERGVFRQRSKSKSDNRDNHRDNFKQGPFSESSSIFPILGLMGLFRGMTAGDIEDEKAKLSDEQKMKKMTPGELDIARGVLSMCDQDYNKASELFHKALRYAQEHDDDGQETLVLNLLASNCFESGDYEAAEKLFIDLIKRMIAHDVEPTDLAILELSLKLASIYSRSNGTHEKAMKGFKFVISTLLNNLEDVLNGAGDLEIQEISEDRKDELALLGWSYDWFAKYLIAIDDFDGAVTMLRKALKISSLVLGPLHDQTLILLNDVGTTMAMNDSPEEGKSYMKKAVEGAIESQSKELASFYVNLGLVNLKLRQLDEAKRYCEHSIELASKNRDHHNADEVIKLSQNCLQEVERLSGGR